MPDKRLCGFKQEGEIRVCHANGSVGEVIHPLDIIGWVADEEVGREIDQKIFAHPFKSISFEECFKVTKPLGELTEEEKRLHHILKTYFGQFSFGWINPEDPVVEGEPPKKYCPACGEPLTGLLANLGYGAAFEWGFIHGFGHCSQCHYPMKGHHYIKDPENPEGEPLLSVTDFFVYFMPHFLDEGGWEPVKVLAE
jgi:hypothetical protein